MAIARLTRPHVAGFAALFLAFGATASADVRVDFTESAPKDRFTISNMAGCDIESLKIAIDLSASVGRLIFDTTADGAGVEVFQPFDAGDDAERLLIDAPVMDGDSAVTLSIPTLPADGRVSFTIDVDDTLTESDLGQIRVTGSEVAGGLIVLTLDTGASTNARFDNDASAVLSVPAC